MVTKEKILVVDDEKVVASALRLILEDSGFSVDTAHDGLEALKQIEKNEEPVKEVSEDFDFNQDKLFDDNEEYRSPGWARLKKKLLK